MKLASQCCFDGVAPNVTKKISDQYLDDNTWSTFIDIAPAFNETFIFCKLFGKKTDCRELFVPRTTERGLCYTFNSLNFHDMHTNE